MTVPNDNEPRNERGDTWRPQRPRPTKASAGWARALVLAPALALAGCPTDPAMPGTDAGPRTDVLVAPDAPSSPDAPPGADAGDPDAGTPDAGPPDAGGPPPVVFTPTELAILATLSPRPALPPDPTNAHADDPAAALLGQRLFFDARYSGPLIVASDLGAIGERGRVSCASCHGSPVMSDDRSPAPGAVSVGTNVHARNAPAIVDSAAYPWTNWGGRFAAQWELPPIVAENAGIMNSTRLEIAHHIFDHYRVEYEAVFGAMDPAIGSDATRFPPAGRPNAASPGAWESMAPADQVIVNRIFVNFGKAIQAYMRQLVSGAAPFDRFVAGDEAALSESARRGLRLFIGEARCVTCHSGPSFSDGEFHNLAVPPGAATDDGRFTSIPPLLGSTLNVAGAYSDDPAAGMARLAGLTNPPPASEHGRFRTPTLRGVEFSAPYMHAGQLATLEEVVEFYDRADGVPASGTRDPMLLPLGLSPEDEADLVEFMMALSGEPVPASLRMTPP